MTNAEKQAAFNERQRAKGMVKVSFYVPQNAVAEITALARLLRDNPHLTVGPVRDPVSGKLVSWRRQGNPIA